MSDLRVVRPYVAVTIALLFVAGTILVSCGGGSPTAPGDAPVAASAKSGQGSLGALSKDSKSKDDKSSDDRSSDADPDPTPTPEPTPTPTPAPACADGSVEVGPEVFGRNDIVFCDAPGSAYPTLSTAFGLCAPGWQLCSEAQWNARNDSCSPDGGFTGWLDQGANCGVMVIDRTGTDRARCNVDGVRGERFRGTCTGSVLPPLDSVGDGIGYSVRGEDANVPGQAPPMGWPCGVPEPGFWGDNCGAICCQ